MASQKKVISLATQLINSDALYERHEHVFALFAALLSSSHILLLGPPGTAKSMLARLFCSCFEGAAYFEWLLTKFSTPEEIFGPLSMKGLENDEYRRVISGKLPTANIAFLDEIFKANSAILNSLLTVINERKYHNNGTLVDVPLLTCIGASNELPEGENLGALYDRFQLRFWVEPIQNDANFITLLQNEANSLPEITGKLTLKEVDELRDAVRDVGFSHEMAVALREIYHELQNAGIGASDRRWKKAVRVMKAYAFLGEKSEVTEDELETLADQLWHKPEDRRAILEVVAPRSNPLNFKAVEFDDAVQELYKNWDPKDDKTGIEANKVLKEIIAKIDETCKGESSARKKKILAVQEKAKTYQKEIMRKLMG